jgi:hypothetical protein
VNKKNDILNCGECGHTCGGTHPYCLPDGGCGAPPCNGVPCAVINFCCGNSCCPESMLCCDVPGPIQTGPACTVPVNGTCPPGCPACY